MAMIINDLELAILRADLHRKINNYFPTEWKMDTDLSYGLRVIKILQGMQIRAENKIYT